MKITNSPEETINYALSMPEIFQPGCVYGLRGDLASGKTTFIKGILLALNYGKVVNSPTFTLINEYDADYKVIHIDCYREDDINRWFHERLRHVFISWIEANVDKLAVHPVDYIDRTTHSTGFTSFLNKNLRSRKHITRPTIVVILVDTIDEINTDVVESC